MSTVFPSLTPAEARILDTLHAHNYSPDCLHALGLSASDILAWSASPAVAAALSSLRQTLAALAHLADLSRAQTARPLALDTLSSVIANSRDPNQRRLAASSLLRTTTSRLQGGAGPRTASPWGIPTRPAALGGTALQPVAQNGTAPQPVWVAQPPPAPPSPRAGPADREGRIAPRAEGPGDRTLAPAAAAPTEPVRSGSRPSSQPTDRPHDPPCHNAQPLRRPAAAHSRAASLHSRAGAALHPP